MNRRQREVVENRVRRGFDLLEQCKPGWWRAITRPENMTVTFAEAVVGRDRVAKALEAAVGKSPSQLDRWIFGLAAVPIWVKDKDLNEEWRRQIEHARASGAALPPTRPDKQLLECALCGAPRWDNETIRWVEGRPVCDPRCP